MNAQLSQYITSKNNVPFNWGTNDCCLFVADWVFLVHEIDLADDFRGKYTTKKGAFKAMFKRGFKDIKTLFKARLNTDINKHYAQRGDIALVEHNNELVGGIIHINSVLCVGDNGIITLAFEHVKHVFPLSPRGDSQ